MKNLHLVREFLEQDCNSRLSQELLAEIAMHGATPVEVFRTYNMNRFDVYLDFQNREARVDDVLDGSAEGSCTLSLAEFSAALTHRFGNEPDAGSSLPPSDGEA